MTPQMFGKIDKKYLANLARDRIPESINLDYKRELNLDAKEGKREAAKDVSAMANSAGGRIVYGIDEQSLPDGSMAAGDIRPLTDGTIMERLETVLLSTIHPRPRFRAYKVEVQGGFALVVEVEPAYARDLHMVTGYSEARFYRRSDRHTIVMTEPEIREAYARIAASRMAIDASMERIAAEERKLVGHLHQSVLILPWFGRDDLLDPLRLGREFGFAIGQAIEGHEFWEDAV